ncbi:MAG: DUF58 domain-containing protein [Desulfobulbaceae bacterium]|jgi:uncharacterized protein (DUF58 family)|nr:DUF58 domain-containing protein [Desulfobulbaceae bacterium]
MSLKDGAGEAATAFSRIALPVAQDIRLRPTGHGIVYVVLLAALLVGSINHNNNLGYLLTFLLSSILLVSVVFTLRNVRDLRCQGHGEAAVFAGQILPFSVALQAVDGPCYGLRLSVDGKTWTSLTEVDTAPKTCQVKMAVSRRGLVAMRRLLVVSGFPLGLLRATREIPVTLTGLVYPKPRRLAARGEQSADEREEDDTFPNRAEGNDFDGLRAYRPGDSPGRLHWKSLAGGRGLFSKFFADDGGGGAIFSLADMPGNNLEMKLGELCFLVLQADGWGRRYGLRLGGRVIAPGRGLPHKNACLRALALYKNTSNAPMRTS